VRGRTRRAPPPPTSGSQLARVELAAAGQALRGVRRAHAAGRAATAEAEWSSVSVPDGTHTVTARASDRDRQRDSRDALDHRRQHTAR
jgi:hypothetical protein